jgi:hypothetical protein
MNRLAFIRNLLALGAGSMVRGLPVKNYRKFYLLQCFVAGFRFHSGMQHLDQMKEGELLDLRREPDNAYDDSAIALYWNELKIGYIPKEENTLLSRLLDAEALEMIAEITHLKKEVRPWENLHIAVSFLKEWDGPLPESKMYLAEVQSPEYRTLSGPERLITRIRRRSDDMPASEPDWYRFFETHSKNDSIYNLLHSSGLDPTYRYGAKTGDYLLVNLHRTSPDSWTDSVTDFVDELYKDILEQADDLEELFGESGYVVLCTREAERLVPRIEKLVEVTDKLGNRYIEMVLKATQ